jgi:hypothetical protein
MTLLSKTVENFKSVSKISNNLTGRNKKIEFTVKVVLEL